MNHFRMEGQSNVNINDCLLVALSQGCGGCSRAGGKHWTSHRTNQQQLSDIICVDQYAMSDMKANTRDIAYEQRDQDF